MHDLFLVLIALLFYTLGRIAGKETETLTEASQTIQKRLFKKKGGIISYPTPQELRYRGSEEEKKDNEFKRTLKQAGILK